MTKPVRIHIAKKQYVTEVVRDLLADLARGYGDVDDATKQMVADVLTRQADLQRRPIEQNYLEIERALQRNFDKIPPLPFIVVASDGSGDYKSIAAAIAASPVTGTNISNMILVKSLGVTYDDTALTSVDFAGKNITIMGIDSTRMGLFVDTPATSPKWTFQFLDNLTGDCQIRLIGLNLVPSQIGGAVFRSAGFTSGAARPTIEHCQITGSVFGSAGIDLTLLTSTVSGAVFTTSGISITNVVIRDCQLNGGIVPGSVILAGAGSLYRLQDNFINQSGTTTFSMAAGAGEGTRIVELIDNQWNTTGAAGITISGLGTGGIINVIGNTHVGTSNTAFTWTVAATSNNAAHVYFNNDMKYAAVVITDTAAQLVGCYIGGLYRSISTQVNATVIDAVLDCRNTTGVTALTISGNGCKATVAVVPGTTTTGYSVSGNNNIVLISNLGALSATGTDSGTGNSINALAPSGSAGGSLSGSYPNPIFAGRDSSVDKINQDMVPAWLGGDAAGVLSVFQYPAPAAGGAVGGALAGTLPNPTFAGRDSSVDEINKDLLPGLLVP